uniref:G-protein coupled receptors family 1 profile domain-containing protein n=1 Tax=Ciona savignyi TaxID=51511 RepID=H2YVS4_CIOSA
METLAFTSISDATTYAYNSNSTDKSNSSLTWNDVKAVWLTSQIFSFVSCTLIIYVIVTMVYRVVKKKIKLSEIFERGLIDYISLLAALAVLLYVVLEIPLITRQYEPYCTIYEKTKVTCFGLSLMCIYSVFWLRMLKAFYLKSAVRGNIGRPLRLISQVTFALLVAMTVIDTGIFLSAPPYRTTALGCEKSGLPSSIAKWIALITTTSLCQGCLLFYFIYPLHLHRKRMISHGINSKSVLPLIKRLVVTMTICVAANIVGYTFIALYKSQTVYVTNIVLGSNLLLHLALLLHSFQNWKNRLFPCCDNILRRPSTWVTSTAEHDNTRKPSQSAK